MVDWSRRSPPPRYIPETNRSPGENLMRSPDQLVVTNEILLTEIEVVAVRLNAQEAIMQAIVTKLGITREEAFSSICLNELGDMEHWLPQIRHAILQTLNQRH